MDHGHDFDFTGCSRAWNAGLGAIGPNVKAALLGRTPRYAPDRAFDTLHVALDLSVDFARRTLSGSCRSRVRAFQGGLRELVFDAVDLKVSRVTVDGARASFTAKNGKLTIRAPKRLDAGQEADVAVDYKAVDPKTGLHFVQPGPRTSEKVVQLWSQSQPEDARYWYPCHDSPHEKCTSEVRLSVPRGFVAVSNGALVESAEKGGRAIFHWRMSQPHSIYLISIAVGRFAEIVDHWEDLPVTYYCERGREEDARRGFRKTVAVIDFFSKKTGVRYAYEKYAQVAVAEYPGGMEHTTCTTQTDACLIDKRAALDVDLDLLVAHELAHQWFGDLVTCRDWSHAWLNEGFATYFEVLFQEHDKGRDEAEHELYMNARSYFDEDQRRYRRPIVTDTFKYPWTVFDRHTYEKGCWVLRMLHRELGDELWWKVIGAYLRKYRDQSVETNDLIETIAEVTGRNLKPFFDQWVFKSGYPHLRAHYSWDDKAKRAELWVLQTQDASDEVPVFKLPLKIRITGRGWTREFDESVSDKDHRFSYKLPSEPLDVELDPEHRLLKRLALRKPHRMWRRQLERGKSAWSRHTAASYVASWGDDESVALIERAIRKEPFWGAAAEMARALGGIRSDAAFAALRRLLASKHPKVRRAVVESLAQQRRPETADLVAPLARRDPSILVEAEANRALGALRSVRHSGLLRANLGKKSYRDVIASAALSGLSALRGRGTIELLRKQSRPPFSYGRRAAALRSLSDYAAVDDGVVPLLCESADDQDERINLLVISLLGGLEDERALPVLDRAKKDANSRVRVYAEEAAARIRYGIEPRKK